ncbi:MAG: hypothetical protein Q8M79_00710 [Dehalococcoidia bacterium]|nr:hypothetical protein [Dehalococcoidia bacterium]
MAGPGLLGHLPDRRVALARAGAHDHHRPLSVPPGRLRGVEITDDRRALALFPNVFEFWFVAVAAALRWRPAWVEAPTRRGLATALGVLTAAKVAHEYVLHVARALDGFTAVEAVQAIWRWIVPG